MSASPYRTQVQPAASFLVCSLIFIEYKKEGYPLFSCQTSLFANHQYVALAKGSLKNL